MKRLQWIFLLLLTSGVAVAEDIEVVGSIEQSIPASIVRLQKNRLLSASQITLLKVALSDNAREKIDARANVAMEANENMLGLAFSSSSKHQLGMENVPVLDQGQHGSCVVFATTAAVDAALSKGDYVSQLCLLQLGRSIASNAYVMSGWNGSNGGTVFNQMNLFGLVSKAQQKEAGCGGLREYPLDGDEEPGSEMTPSEYHALSEKMDPSVIGSSVVLDVYQVFLDKINMQDVLKQVKAALNAGDRLTVGVLLPGANRGVIGAEGRYHVPFDSWVLTPEILDDLNSQAEVGAHELVITGYDDNAVAIDKRGEKHKGLLTLRNSWGPNIGDRGDFYMSYDYFKTLTFEALRIRRIPT